MPDYFESLSFTAAWSGAKPRSSPARKNKIYVEILSVKWQEKTDSPFYTHCVYMMQGNADVLKKII